MNINIYFHDTENEKKLDQINDKLDQLLQDKIDKGEITKATDDLKDHTATLSEEVKNNY